jgi:hypothetical protein
LPPWASRVESQVESGIDGKASSSAQFVRFACRGVEIAAFRVPDRQVIPSPSYENCGRTAVVQEAVHIALAENFD